MVFRQKLTFHLVKWFLILDLSASLLVYFCLWGINVFPRCINKYGFQYFAVYYGQRIFPIVLFIYYLLAETAKTNVLKKIGDAFAWITLPTTFVALFTVCLLQLLHIQSSALTSQYYDWTFQALTTWLTTYMISFLLCYRKTKNPLTSLTFSLLLIMVAGAVYELPRDLANPYTLTRYIDPREPFLISTKIMSGFFLAFMLYEHKWKAEKIFTLCLILYVLHGVWYAQHPSPGFGYFTYVPQKDSVLRFLFEFLQRLPGVALMLSLTCGIKKKVG